MEFDKSKVFTPFNCEEVKIGSKGYFADNLFTLKEGIEINAFKDLEDVDLSSNLPFYTKGAYYRFFYLVEEPKEKIRRPCTRKELIEMLKKQGLPMVLCKNDGFTYSIVRLDMKGITVISVTGFHLTYGYRELCNTFTLLDGTELWVEE